MPRPCAACTSPNGKAIDQKIRSGTTLVDVARWLKEIRDPISRNALSRHLAHIGVGPRPSGPRPAMSDDLAENIVSIVNDRVQSGDAVPTVRDGLSAQSLLEARKSRDLDRSVWARVTLALTGHVNRPMLRDPEVEAIEGEFRELLENPGMVVPEGELARLPATTTAD